MATTKKSDALYFRKPSEKAIKHGKARMLYEDIVRRAERKLLQLATGSIISVEEKAEVIAKTLFHTPGSVLAADEVDMIYTSSGCRELLITPICSPNSPYRTIDGTCNNLANPTQGAAGTPFRRMLPAHYEDGISSIRGEIQHYGNILPIGPFDAPIPSARLISQSIVLDKPFDELQASHMLMQFGQYLEHDVTRTPGLAADCVGCQYNDVCLPIFVPSDDPDFGIGTFRNGSCLEFKRNIPACTYDPPGTFSPRQHINDFTSYVDGSVIYGSDDNTAKSLRDATGGGRLRTGFTLPNNTKPSLPLKLDKENEFAAGDPMVILQPGLVAMATIWMREHNRVAALLASLNPSWVDERLYQEARKIVGAEFQKVSYFEFLPLLLGNDTYNAIIGPYRGYNPNADASLPTELSTAAYRMGHSLVRPSLPRLLDDYMTSIPAGEQPLAFFEPVDKYNKSLGTDPLLRGLLTAPARRRDEYVINILTTKLFEEGTPGNASDLISLTIQRGRDHGLPPYPIVRNFCKSVYNISSPLEHQLTFIRLLQNYGSLDTTDLWVGGDAEQRLPGSILGATFACIFGNAFANLRDGDRFYFENPEVFTTQQLAEIKKVSLSKIICDNSDGITQIQPNAFLSNQTRVPCSALPSLDLTPWSLKELPVSNNVLLKQLENDLQSIMSKQD